jgi:hypothetical protein
MRQCLPNPIIVFCSELLMFNCCGDAVLFFGDTKITAFVALFLS